ncbi:MAG: PAS-domain containing protein, partial [Aquisalimonadaceae bacterium]
MSGYWPRLIVCIVLLVGAPLAHGDESPAPVVDLSEWDVGADPARELREGWTVRRGSTGASPLPATVPQSWPATLAGGERLPRFGEAWYEIRLRLPASDGPLALRLRSFQAAVAVYANGQRLAQRGRPGDARNEVPDTRPLLVRIPSSDTEITLTLHISNHFHGAGGLREVVVIGDQAWLEQRQRLTDMLMAALIGGLLLLAVYLLALYPRKRVAGGLWLAALLGVVALRIAAVSHFLEFVPGAGSSVTQRVAYLTVFLTGPLVFLLLRSLYPNDLQRFAGWLIGAFGLAGVAACLTLSVPNFTRLQSPVAFVVMVMAAYFVWRVVVAVRRRRPGARLIAAGTAVMAAAVSNDALLYAGVLETVNLIAPGMLVFLAAHAFVLGGRVLDTLTDNELLNARLAALNRNLERSVSARTRDLLSQSDLLITTLESMEPALLAINGQGRVVAFNQAFLALFGLSRSEVKGSTRDHLREVMAERNSALAGDDGEAGLLPPPGAMQAGHSDLHLSNGEVIEISRRPTATGGYVSTFQDVTAQRVAELGPEGGAVGIWDRNLRIGRLTCSDRYWSMLGFDPQAVPPDIMHRHIADWLSVIHPDDRRMADAVMEQGRRGDMPLLFNCRIQTREADWLWVTVRGQVIRDDRGVPVRMVGTQTDIDAIVRAQQAMREARDFAEADARHKSHFLAS